MALVFLRALCKSSKSKSNQNQKERFAYFLFITGKQIKLAKVRNMHIKSTNSFALKILQA